MFEARVRFEPGFMHTMLTQQILLRDVGMLCAESLEEVDEAVKEWVR